jgi:hypothetical protein
MAFGCFEKEESLAGLLTLPSSKTTMTDDDLDHEATREESRRNKEGLDKC